MMGFVRGTTIFLGLLALFALCADGAPGERKLIKRSDDDLTPEELLVDDHEYYDYDEGYVHGEDDGEEGTSFFPEEEGGSDVVTYDEHEHEHYEPTDEEYEYEDITINGGSIENVNQWEGGHTGGQGNRRNPGKGGNRRRVSNPGKKGPKGCNCPKPPSCKRKPKNQKRGNGPKGGNRKGNGKKRAKASDSQYEDYYNINEDYAEDENVDEIE